MKNHKAKSNPILRIIATMKLAKALKCSFKEADKKMKAMNVCKLRGGSTNARKSN